jgi:hypothetical protein
MSVPVGALASIRPGDCFQVAQVICANWFAG